MGSTRGYFLPVPIALCLLLGFGTARPGSGADPVLHIAGYQDGGVRVSCLSAGWYPEPHVLWSNSRGEPLSPASEEKPRSADGFFNVSSSLVLAEHSDPTLTCLVGAGASGAQAETTIRITGLFPRQDPKKTASILLLVTFLLLLVLAPGLRWKIRALQDEASKEHDWKKFLDKVVLSAADITLDRSTANPFLVLSADDRGVTCGVFWQDVPKSHRRFDFLPGVLASQSFAAGQHYWEVEVDPDPGRDWAIGVARDSVERLGMFKPSSDVGIWALQCQEGAWNALTYPPTPLPLASAPRVVRLHLDCEQGRLAFYDAESMAHIFTFAGCPREALFPFFLLWTSGTQLTILPPSQAKEADGPTRARTRTQRKRQGSVVELLIQRGKS